MFLNVQWRDHLFVQVIATWQWQGLGWFRHWSPALLTIYRGSLLVGWIEFRFWR